MAQKDTNPFEYSDSNKRYFTYDYYTRKTFGGKCARIPLDMGFSCPNKDGKCGRGGCIYCLSGSSSSVGESIEEQYENAAGTARRKWKISGFIPYLQAGSNTYAPREKLRAVYDAAASLPGAVMLDIATRADCLEPYVIEEIERISEKLPVTVELGLQTSNDKTAAIINRGYSFDVFRKGYEKLLSARGNIRTGIHIINGLPGEKAEDMLKTAADSAALHPHLVKIHCLNVLAGTKLEEMYRKGEYVPMEAEEYADITVRQLELLPPDTVIGRAVSDAPGDVLIAPLWCVKKTAELNLIDRMMYERNTLQGRLFEG